MLRYALAFLAAAAGALAMFWIMQWMITPKNSIVKNETRYNMVDFIRLKRESEPLEHKKRKPPEVPKPKPTPQRNTPVASQQQTPQNINIDVPRPTLNASMQFAQGPKLALPTMQGDSELMPLVRIRPQYPMRARRMGIEGYVSLRVFVNAQGLVERVEVIESDPKGVFEREAIRALKRWKFKPKTEDGKAIRQNGTLRLDFKMKEA